jgi:hypothetical protein
MRAIRKLRWTAHVPIASDNFNSGKRLVPAASVRIQVDLFSQCKSQAPTGGHPKRALGSLDLKYSTCNTAMMRAAQTQSRKRTKIRATFSSALMAQFSRRSQLTVTEYARSLGRKVARAVPHE